ncbi:hypothetical protein [Metamycoplasma alkalescens]|uniref:Uncharacterized protein n=2 Tax=Metamycoplasma alkalescens TaxID=45363 RepID=N9SQU0_9BACT|nr:hypothetical protein [Metamycoplasma alkalescens]ENY53805.1 Hypothetical protein, predicted transmembrane protein [Metamycoplasma alkalescens 14918]PYF42183.1 hypothetical protein BCF88_1177 [Metamycoplasma alkalescens]
MSNHKKWKNKKININNYQSFEIKKEKRTLSDSWKTALTSLFLIAIPSFILFLLIGKDGWIIPTTKNFARWELLLPVAILIATLQTLVACLLIFKFKALKRNSLIFLVPFAIAMSSFVVSSGAESWIYRVLPAVGLALLALPILLVIKKIEKNIDNKKRIELEKLEKEQKSLLD